MPFNILRLPDKLFINAIAMYTKGSFGRLSTDIELLLMFDVLPI